MRRGTTVANVFTVDADLTGAVVLYVTYKQGNTTIIEKSKDDIQITAETLTVELTQNDTLAMSSDRPIQIQIRARLADGSALASNIITTTAGGILKDGVI